MPPSELCEVVITAPDPEWLKAFSRTQSALIPAARMGPVVQDAQLAVFDDDGDDLAAVGVP